MIDVYCNVLPVCNANIESMDKAYELILKLIEVGYDEFVIPCPLYNEGTTDLFDLKVYRKELDELIALFEARQPANKYKFYKASVFKYISEPSTILRKIKAFSVNMSKYVYIELDNMEEYDPMFMNFLSDLMLANYEPVLLHVEKYKMFVDHDEILQALIKKGCYMEVSLASLDGIYGLAMRDHAYELLNKAICMLIGSDIGGHHSEFRFHRVQQAIQFINKDLVYNIIFKDNPINLVNGYDIIQIRGDNDFKFSYMKNSSDFEVR